jgi:hypothetical protein
MKPILIHIVAAKQVGAYGIHLAFDDGSEQLVDFQPFLSRSPHPEIRKWLSPEKFSSFHIEYGELLWGDYELCFPVIDLYCNQLDHRNLQQSAA